MTRIIQFYKDREGWFANVEGHTKSENRMILGADTFLQRFDNLTDKNGGVTVVCDNHKIDKPAYILKRIMHGLFGAYYVVMSDDDKYGLDRHCVYLCNVVHTVFGKHPRKIYIKEIK